MTDQNEFTPEAIEKAKDRIRKLTAMAADSSSPHEAAIAAERVKKLKDKYDLHDFEATGEIREEFDEQIATRYYSAIPNWMKFFSVAVATYNDCIMDSPVASTITERPPRLLGTPQTAGLRSAGVMPSALKATNRTLSWR
ncbi:hypothetical protein PII10A_25 [Pseudomonas aeruginosa]|nr:hypothetical protein PII10A_25 [Pseudomonas aeruginosa]